MAKKKSKSTTVSVNFKGVEGRTAGAKPGEYIGEVEEVEKDKGDAGEYLKWTFVLGEDGDEGKAWFYTSLTKQSLWNLRGLLEAMGEEVPDDEMDIDLEEMVGKKVGVVIEMEEYQGKDRPKMVDYMPVDDIGPSEDKSDKKKKKKGKKDAEKPDEDAVNEMDRDELETVNDDHKLEVDFDDYEDDKKGLKKLRKAIIEALDGEVEPEDDKKDKKKKKGKEKLDKDEVEAMDQEELADVIKDNKLDVDLDDFKSLKKMVKAVIEALEAEDLL